MDSVVVVLGVGRVHGDERQVAPILAGAAQPNGPRAFRLLQRRGREDVRDAMGRERDEAHRALGLDRADRLDDARGGGAKPGLAQGFDGDEIAVARFAGLAGGHEIFARRAALLDGKRAARAVGRGAIDGEGARLDLVEDLDHPARIGRRCSSGVGVELDPHQDPRAHARRRRAVALQAGAAHENSWARAVLAPFGGLGDQLAVAVELGDVGDDERGQAALDLERPAIAPDRALRLQVLDEELQFRLGLALDAEGAGDVALADPRGRPFSIGGRRSAEESHELVARRERGRPRRCLAATFGPRRGTLWSCKGFTLRAAEAPHGERKFNAPRKQAAAQPTAENASVQCPFAFSILSSVNSFMGGSSARSTMRASGCEAIQSPIVE